MITSAGLPIGTTFSFLISSPLVDLASIILLASIFNWKIAIAYVALDEVLDIIKKVWLYILIGVGIGAAIHNYIPEEVISAILGQDKWYSVLVATFVDIPMYADIFGTLPIAEALVLKGVGIGTALSFMMGVTALSLLSIIMLKKVVKPKLLFTFIGIVSIGIIIIGYTFNAFAYLFI